ncbi:MAG: CocE/NonD family hydrolase [Gemmatimonadaceae bacterium]
MTIGHRSLVAVAVFASVACITSAAASQTPAAKDSTPLFDETDVQIPMRDGVHLHTSIFVPRGNTANLPFILNRTPYGIGGMAAAFNAPAPSLVELINDGYIFVVQDIRGRFGSEGQFVMLRPMRDKSDKSAIDESTDAYDTIDWLLKNIAHNNGRVGMLGTSYPGWLTVIAMLDPHPALKAVAPAASPADMFIGDDFHHNGAFRLSYGFEYAAMMERSKEFSPFDFGVPDVYDWYLNLGSLSHANEKALHDQAPTWNNFVSHPNYDAFWQTQAVAPYLDRVKVPTLNIAGWWDQEDFFGPIKIYETLEPHDTQHLNYLVVGPWNHGGWSASEGQKLGPIDFGEPASANFRRNIEAPWFAYWLKDKGTLKLAEATTFESGADKWRSHDSWPERTGVANQKLYLRANHRLSFTAPKESGASAVDSYISDPANPVPYRKRPISPTFIGTSTWSTWLVDDQRFAQARPDVATWQSAPLTSDVVVAGAIAAHLFASTTGSDADWIVKLIDVYPDQTPDPKLAGYELMVANDVLRARFRDGFEHPKAIVPKQTTEFTVDLHTQDYRFLKGHRIMVQVQSSWFPLIDRNPQTFVRNIFKAKDSDFQKATQRIFRSAKAASYVLLPIEGSADGVADAH